MRTPGPPERPPLTHRSGSQATPPSPHAECQCLPHGALSEQQVTLVLPSAGLLRYCHIVASTLLPGRCNRINLLWTCSNYFIISI